ncbi:MBL fold metallo-hydrolase [Moraxella sp.]|uniref:MBL fold metallo-hydrolase n=1 Tax=Moraxella sp. TaxID=479 RepID=UPI002635EAAA|nr:MBL fold metallo-hydrolase [Moraxella sp.]MCP3896387.1 MBL fold metallo-hydrolase [Moraxella sp.]
MIVHSFLDPQTETYSHILIDDDTKLCAIIDPVLDYDPVSGRINHDNADKLINFITRHDLTVKYIIETHAHADHVTSAHYLKERLGGQTVIGKYIATVQHIFKDIYDLDDDFVPNASQFDHLTDDGTTLTLGSLSITAMHVAGHTPADMAYQVTDDTRLIVFVGDTLFAPDVGTARCDFPAGDSGKLYDSIQRILALPDETVLYLCHDYPPEHREYSPTTTVGEQRRHNIHVKDGISRDDFINMRDARDKTLSVPRLMLPSVQVNINAGEFFTTQNGKPYVRIPVNQF